MKRSTRKGKKPSLKKPKPKVESKLEAEIEGLAAPEQPLLYFGPPPAIKQLYKKTDFDPEFHPFDLIEHLREGHSRSEIVASWGITYSKFNEWLDAYPEFAEAFAVGKPAFDAYHKRALRLCAFGQLPKARENSLFFLLKNQAGFEDGGGHEEFPDSHASELEFVDDDEV